VEQELHALPEHLIMSSSPSISVDLIAQYLAFCVVPCGLLNISIYFLHVFQPILLLWVLVAVPRLQSTEMPSVSSGGR
jgi:hypothetical protein